MNVSSRYLSDEILGTDRVDSADLGQRLDVTGAIRRIRVEPSGPAGAVAFASLVGWEGEMRADSGGRGGTLLGALRVA